MKITRKQLRKIIRESLEDSRSVIEMFRGWDPYNINQALELNDTLADEGSEEFPVPVDVQYLVHYVPPKKNANNHYLYVFKFFDYKATNEFYELLIKNNLARGSKQPPRITRGDYVLEQIGPQEIQVYQRVK